GGGCGGRRAAPSARKLCGPWRLGKLPDGVEPLGAAPARASCAGAGAAAEAGCTPATDGELPLPPPPSRRTPAQAGDRNPADNNFGSWLRRQPQLQRAAAPTADAPATRPAPATVPAPAGDDGSAAGTTEPPAAQENGR